MRSCGLAGQTIMLAAKAMGYDSLPDDRFRSGSGRQPNQLAGGSRHWLHDRRRQSDETGVVQAGTTAFGRGRCPQSVQLILLAVVVVRAAYILIRYLGTTLVDKVKTCREQHRRTICSKPSLRSCCDAGFSVSPCSCSGGALSRLRALHDVGRTWNPFVGAAGADLAARAEWRQTHGALVARARDLAAGGTELRAGRRGLGARSHPAPDRPRSGHQQRGHQQRDRQRRGHRRRGHRQRSRQPPGRRRWDHRRVVWVWWSCRRRRRRARWRSKGRELLVSWSPRDWMKSWLKVPHRHLGANRSPATGEKKRIPAGPRKQGADGEGKSALFGPVTLSGRPDRVDRALKRCGAGPQARAPRALPGRGRRPSLSALPEDGSDGQVDSHILAIDIAGLDIRNSMEPSSSRGMVRGSLVGVAMRWVLACFLSAAACSAEVPPPSETAARPPRERRLRRQYDHHR